MNIRITFPLKNGERVVSQAEILNPGDTANAIRCAHDLARKKDPSCLIANHKIKLESSRDA